MKQSYTPKEEAKGTKDSQTLPPPEIYKRSAIVFRAQKYASIKMTDLWAKNSDFFEIKKHLSSIGYKPLDKITD